MKNMDDNKALLDRAPEIVAVLKGECVLCSVRRLCKDGVDSARVYCPNKAAATTIEAQAAQLAAVTAERDAAVACLEKIDAMFGAAYPNEILKVLDEWRGPQGAGEGGA